MSKDRRKHPRRDVNYACWVGGPNAPQLVQGKILNISEGGAKVVCGQQSDIPDDLDLYMTLDGKVGRRCKVVWRSDDALGLMFVARTTLPSHADLIEI
jgi:hypothetical protein